MKRPKSKLQSITVYTLVAAFVAMLVYSKFTSLYMADDPKNGNSPAAAMPNSHIALSGPEAQQPAPAPAPNAPAPAPAPQEGTSDAVVPKKPDPLSKRVVQYHMSAKLDAETKTIYGNQTVTWTNPGTKAVSELYFHLYPNAFASDKSTFMRESGGKHREDSAKANSYGGMTIDSLKASDGSSLDERLEFVQPDDDNSNDRTLAMLKLPVPVLPGQQTTLQLQFTVKLPSVFARMGYSEDFVMAGQWFPKVAVYEPAGTRGRTEDGWNTHQYHGNSEFYSDFGIYNVMLEVPDTYTVAATGFPTTPVAKTGNGTKTYHFYADDVHDFAWAASPHFVYHEEPFSTDHIPGMKIKLYLDPKHEHLKERYLQATKKSLARYSEWYGAYPYSTLSVVVPPAEANGAGGMEYPTLITAWGAAEETPGLELERVVVHEIGHQYWYGMVASNEFEEAWLDEGFTSYTEDKLMETEYGSKPSRLIEASYITAPEPLTLNAWKYHNHNTYAENVYTRAKLVLTAMEQQIGEKQMKQVLKTYYQQWKFRHPSTKDFQTVVEKVTGQSWKPFFDQYIYNGLMADYAIESIVSTPSGGENGQPAGYQHEITVRRLGGDYTPIKMRLHFADGSYADQTINQTEDRSKVKIVHPQKLKWAMLDPSYEIVLENKHINNFMKTEVDEKWKVRLNVGTVKLIETLLSWVAW
nr:M1 family metallopeptidase [Paenibacillus turpanensis]